MNQRLFPLAPLSFPALSYCALYKAFDNGWSAPTAEKPEPEYDPARDELKKIIDLGELLKFEAGRVGSNVQVKQTRDSDIAWIDDNPQAPALDVRMWLIGKLTNTIRMVNRDKFQFLLDGFTPPQYTKYALNQHYNWHTDNFEGAEADIHRRLSAVLMVTPPDQYEGGELELNLNGNPEDTILLKPNAGDIIFFRSTLPHRVRPVTSGNRISLVTWAMGPKES